jgi:ribosomal protein S20
MAYKDLEKEKAAKKRYYDSHREVYRAKNKRKKDRLRTIIRDIKARPCANCGGLYPYYVMDFDHRVDEEKIAHVSKLVQRLNIPRLMDEIAKCDVVCANCHRIRTYERGQRFSEIV